MCTQYLSTHHQLWIIIIIYFSCVKTLQIIGSRCKMQKSKFFQVRVKPKMKFWGLLINLGLVYVQAKIPFHPREKRHQCNRDMLQTQTSNKVTHLGCSFTGIWRLLTDSLLLLALYIRVHMHFYNIQQCANMWVFCITHKFESPRYTYMTHMNPCS